MTNDQCRMTNVAGGEGEGRRVGAIFFDRGWRGWARIKPAVGEAKERVAAIGESCAARWRVGKVVG